MNIIFLTLLCVGIQVQGLNGSLPREHQSRRISARRGVEKKSNLVVQLDMPDNQEVPEFTIFFNGTQQRCDDNGMATFSLEDDATPEKWYVLITKHVTPAFTEINTLSTLRALPEKEYLYYSLRWDEKPRQWTIIKKDLKDKNLEVPKPSQCVIINIHPRHVAGVGTGEQTTMPPMHPHMLWLPRVELKDFPDKPLIHASKKSLLGNQACAPMHQQLSRVSKDLTNGRTPVRTVQVSPT